MWLSQSADLLNDGGRQNKLFPFYSIIWHGVSSVEWEIETLWTHHHLLPLTTFLDLFIHFVLATRWSQPWPFLPTPELLHRDCPSSCPSQATVGSAPSSPHPCLCWAHSWALDLLLSPGACPMVAWFPCCSAAGGGRTWMQPCLPTQTITSFTKASM